MMFYYNLLLIAAFGLKRVALVHLKNDNPIENYIFANKSTQSSLGVDHDIPEYLVKMYQANAKDDGTLKGDSIRIPRTIHGFIGQGKKRLSVFFFSF